MLKEFKEVLFNGKILLFGEYGIIQDTMGLSIPYDSYKGALLFGKKAGSNFSDKSKNDLREYLKHLKTREGENEVSINLNLSNFEKDLDEGMYFDSTIPQGFGLGSSGALVAALYDRYSDERIDPNENVNNEELLKLKAQFAEMEAYFHGTSSGLDPLICYLNLPILIKSKNDLNTVGLPEEIAGKGGIFLLNTGAPGKTQPLVNLFMEQCKEEGFRNMIKKQFKKYNDACIESFLNRDIKPLLENVKELSNVLLENFKPMIPKVFHKLWKEGIESNAYYLKLCGSGGGGFILGFTADYALAEEKLKDYQLSKIYSF